MIFRMPLFNFEFLVLFDDLEKSIKKIEKYLEAEVEDYKNNSGFSVGHGLKCAIWIDSTNKHVINVIIHESYHAMKWMYRLINANGEDEELNANIIANIAENILTAYNILKK